MAQNVQIAGASYPDVPAVDLPKTGGGTARFVDSSDANAAASDILAGKTAYVNGVKLTGTGSGSDPGYIKYTKASGETYLSVPDADAVSYFYQSGVKHSGIRIKYGGTFDVNMILNPSLTGTICHFYLPNGGGVVSNTLARLQFDTANKRFTVLELYVNNVSYTSVFASCVCELYVYDDAKILLADGGNTDTVALEPSAPAVSRSAKLQSKSVTYTSNGTATVTADSGYDGLSSVEVTTNVSGGGAETCTFTLSHAKPGNVTYSIVYIDINDNMQILNTTSSTTFPLSITMKKTAFAFSIIPPTNVFEGSSISGARVVKIGNNQIATETTILLSNTRYSYMVIPTANVVSIYIKYD